MRYNNDLFTLQKYVCLELKVQRILLGLRQDKVAFDLDISPSYLSSIENGNKSKIAFVTLMNLADYYELDFKAMLSRAEENMKNNEDR